MNFYHSTQDLYELLVDEKPKMIAFIRAKKQSHTECEDIYQEAMERFLRRFQQGSNPSEPIPYVYRIILNIINDSYRKEGKQEKHEALTEDIECPIPQPDKQLETQQRLQLFVSCLNTLPDEIRHIIVLRKLHGLSNAEIGRRLGRSDKAIEKRLNRALKTIEQLMATSIARPAEHQTQKKAT
ncbi:RNA polymerase sigma factor [Teredinibacter haidensis]|uniref:RNA polymerase sigma factor n=1 Tax=Teredinibacter haidensis TaxID=2731755 RepID=UPI00094908A3|nr:sigma-70 family RNA polymerase sigma factor [Teredinibacter haidensis]